LLQLLRACNLWFKAFILNHICLTSRSCSYFFARWRSPEPRRSFCCVSCSQLFVMTYASTGLAASSGPLKYQQYRARRAIKMLQSLSYLTSQRYEHYGAATFPPPQHQQQQRSQQQFGSGGGGIREQSYDFDYSIDDDAAAPPPGYAPHPGTLRQPGVPASNPLRAGQGVERSAKAIPKPQATTLSRAPAPPPAVLKAMPAALRCDKRSTCALLQCAHELCRSSLERDKKASDASGGSRCTAPPLHGSCF
jgi:hypothetical protein